MLEQFQNIPIFFGHLLKGLWLDCIILPVVFFVIGVFSMTLIKPTKRDFAQCCIIAASVWYVMRALFAIAGTVAGMR